jgi:hypothetical protein
LNRGSHDPEIYAVQRGCFVTRCHAAELEIGPKGL